MFLAEFFLPLRTNLVKYSLLVEIIELRDCWGYGLYFYVLLLIIVGFGKKGGSIQGEYLLS